MNCSYVETWIWHEITKNGWYVMKPNQTKPNPSFLLDCDKSLVPFFILILLEHKTAENFLFLSFKGRLLIFYNCLPCLYPRTRVTRSRDYMHSIFFIFILFCFIFWCLFCFSVTLIVLSLRDERFCKLQFLYFILVWTARYLVNPVFGTFLRHTHSSHYYLDGASFKEPNSFQFLFLDLSICIFYDIHPLICYNLLALTYHSDDIFFFHHHHHHVVLVARISLTLSRHSLINTQSLYLIYCSLFFSVYLDCKVPENKSFFGVSYWFLLLFIPFFRI